MIDGVAQSPIYRVAAGAHIRRQKAEGRRQKAESRKQKDPLPRPSPEYGRGGYDTRGQGAPCISNFLRRHHLSQRSLCHPAWSGGIGMNPFPLSWQVLPASRSRD